MICSDKGLHWGLNIAYPDFMIKSREFGKLPSGERIEAYDFSTEAGFQATILSYGAILQSLKFPDGLDVVLGFDGLDGYVGEHPYFGTIIGRVANRTSGASFIIDGRQYDIPKNENENNLHSGPHGFDRVNWVGEIDGNTLVLSHTSPDGHQGFPGELHAELRFTFEGSKLTLHIEAKVDKPCPVNITYHPYFNLTDGGATACTDHQLQIYSKFYTHSDQNNIPTGERSRSACSAHFAYNSPKYVGNDDHLDQNFIIKALGADDEGVAKMAKLSSDTTGHKIIVCSTQPCLQAYAGIHIPQMTGKAGLIYNANHGVALEPQGYPDGVNQDSFPTTVLRPGERYNQRIVYTFRPGEAQA